MNKNHFKGLLAAFFFTLGMNVQAGNLTEDNSETSLGIDGKIIGKDSETNLSSEQLLDEIDPVASFSKHTSNTGYEHLKGKTIQYVFNLYNSNSQANGMIMFTVDASGKVQASYSLDFASTVNRDYDYPYKYMNGLAVSNLTNKTMAHRAVGYGPDYGTPYDGMVALDNAGVSVINSEIISFPPYMNATVTPAGLSVELNGELTGIYHTTFIPWPKNRVSQARYSDNDYESRESGDDYVNSLFFVKDLK